MASLVFWKEAMVAWVHLPRRALLGGTIGVVLQQRALAETAISRGARIVVGVPPGSGPDTLARLLAPHLSGSYAPQVIVENRTGASARLAVEVVKAAPPDGTAMLLAASPVLTLYPHAFPRSTRYDALADFQAVATVGEVVQGFLVRTDHPAHDVEGFANWARARGGAYFGPPVLGAPQHLLGLEFGRLGRFPMTAVPFRGGSQAVQALLSGDIHAVFSTTSDVVGLQQGGLGRIIGVTAAHRLPRLPGIATFAEAGFPSLTAQQTYVVLLPAGASVRLVEALHRSIMAGAETVQMREALERLEVVPGVQGPQQAVARIRAERDAWGPIVRAFGFDGDA